MMVKTKLAEIQEELAQQFEKVILKGHGLSSFLYLVNKGRAVEISEDDGSLWIEFWEKSDDEDAAPVNEMTVSGPAHAIMEAKRWLA